MSLVAQAQSVALYGIHVVGDFNNATGAVAGLLQTRGRAVQGFAVLQRYFVGFIIVYGAANARYTVIPKGGEVRPVCYLGLG